VDARTPMVLSVLATIAAMIAKELAGILVVIFMPRHAYADVLDVAADSIISALYLMYRVIQDCFRPVGLRAAIVDPTGKHTKPLIPMEHFIPKITMLWKVLVVVEVLASLTLVATAFYQIVVFRGYITDHVQQPYEGAYCCSRQSCCAPSTVAHADSISLIWRSCLAQGATGRRSTFRQSTGRPVQSSVGAKTGTLPCTRSTSQV